MKRSLLGLGLLGLSAFTAFACGSDDSSPAPANSAGPGGGTPAGAGGNKATGGTAAGGNEATGGATASGGNKAGGNAAAGNASGGNTSAGNASGGSGGSAEVTCTNDVDCPGSACGTQVCSWTAVPGKHVCVDAGTDPVGSDGWCTVDSDCKCAPQGATCTATAPHCSFTQPATGGGGAGGDATGTGGAGGDTSGDDGGAGGDTSGDDGGAGGDTSGDDGGAGGDSSGAAGAGGGSDQKLCTNDDDCDTMCGGQVCSWTAVPGKHVCVDASTGDPGWCTTSANCLCDGATCSGVHCTFVTPGDGG